MTMTSREGDRSPFLRAGTLFLSQGKEDERYDSRRHHVGTKANCTMVRVIGLGSAFKMDLDEVFVRAEVVYQIRQRTYPMNELTGGCIGISGQAMLLQLSDKTQEPEAPRPIPAHSHSHWHCVF